jgi:Pyridoxamine 5'-phosphate oxidase
VDELPHCEPGTPAVLSVSGPHAIPVSTAARASGDRIVFALARRRDTLARLREDPRAALCLMGEGIAFTAVGAVQVVREELGASPHVAALELRVTHVQDHLADGRTEMLDGARWGFTSDGARDADAAVREELAGL